MIGEKVLMKEENGVSRKDPSKTRRSFLPSLQIKPCEVRRKCGKNLSIQHGNTDTFLLCSSLLRIVSTLVMLLEMEVNFPHAWACLRCYAVM